LYSALLKNDLTYGMCDIDQHNLDRLRELSEEVDGWIIWIDDSDDESLSIEKWGPRFVSMNEWKKIYEEYSEKHESK
jgi:hypothetical protein